MVDHDPLWQPFRRPTSSRFLKLFSTFRESKNSALDKWGRLTSAYNNGALTRESDRFVAIAGLARRLQPILNCQYLAGLWQYRFVEQLSWMNRSDRWDVIVLNPPTWSWACRPGSITQPRLIPGLIADMTVGEIKILTVDGDDKSQVISGHLQVTARLIPVRCNDFVYRSDCRLRDSVIEIKYDVSNNQLQGQLFGTICVYKKYDSSGYSDVRGLILKATEQERGQYRRVGGYNDFVTALNGSDSILRAANPDEKAQITPDLYEKYHEDTDKYTFTII